MVVLVPFILAQPLALMGGGADVASQVQEGLTMSYREFVAMMERYERERNRRAFA